MISIEELIRNVYISYNSGYIPDRCIKNKGNNLLESIYLDCNVPDVHKIKIMVLYSHIRVSVFLPKSIAKNTLDTMVEKNGISNNVFNINYNDYRQIHHDYYIRNEPFVISNSTINKPSGDVHVDIISGEDERHPEHILSFLMRLEYQNCVFDNALVKHLTTSVKYNNCTDDAGDTLFNYDATINTRISTHTNFNSGSLFVGPARTGMGVIYPLIVP